MKVLKAIFIFVLIVFGVIIFLEILPVSPKYSNPNPWIVEKGTKPLIIPHGGAKLLYPENTIYAYEKLEEDNYDVFEVDLTLTNDEKLITHHDISLERTISDPELINNLTYDEIVSKYINSSFAEDFRNFEGQGLETIDIIKDKIVPATLDYLFTKYKDKMFILELKDTKKNSGNETMVKAVDKLIQLIDEHRMKDNVIVAAFDDDIIKLIREKSNGEMITTASTNEAIKFVKFSLLRIDFFYRPQDGVLMLPADLKLSEQRTKTANKFPGFIRKQIIKEKAGSYYTDLVKSYLIKDAHRHNIAIFYWTVNDEEQMKALIELGVDGIITDRPDILRKVYEEMGI